MIAHRAVNGSASSYINVLLVTLLHALLNLQMTEDLTVSLIPIDYILLYCPWLVDLPSSILSPPLKNITKITCFNNIFSNEFDTRKHKNDLALNNS